MTNQKVLRQCLTSLIVNIPHPEVIDPFVSVIEAAMDACFIQTESAVCWTEKEKTSVRYMVYAKLLLNEEMLWQK